MGEALDKSAPFPMDWNDWRKWWNTWVSDQGETLGRSSYRFPAPNALADYVLGVWSIGGRNVELSDVTFNIGLESRRYVGITFGQASGNTTCDLCGTFADLERALNMTGEGWGDE